MPFSFQGIEFDENGTKLFEGEFKDGQYWNGKGKKKPSNVTQIHHFFETTLSIQSYHLTEMDNYAKRNSLKMEIASRNVKKK